jgi:hypothetical protein
MIKIRRSKLQLHVNLNYVFSLSNAFLFYFYNEPCSNSIVYGERNCISCQDTGRNHMSKLISWNNTTVWQCRPNYTSWLFVLVLKQSQPQIKSQTQPRKRPYN